MSAPDGSLGTRFLREGFFVTAGVAAVVWLLGQPALLGGRMVGADGGDSQLLEYLMASGIRRYYHPLFLPLAGLFADLGGLGPQAALSATSALLTAAGSAFVHVFLRRQGLPMVRALGGAALVPACASVAAFSVISEIHAAHVAAAGAALLAGWHAARLTLSRAAVLGGLTSFAIVGLHLANALFLPVLCLMAGLGEGVRIRWRRFAAVAGACAAGIAAAAASPFLMAEGGRERAVMQGAGAAGTAADIVARFYDEAGHGAAAALDTLWGEFLMPLAPLSVVGLLCLAGARRRTALACGAGLLAHLVFYAAYNVPEHGGFFTGCAVLLAVMAACRLPAGALAGLLAVQIAAGAWIGTLDGVRMHDRPAPHDAAWIEDATREMEPGSILVTEHRGHWEDIRYHGGHSSEWIYDWILQVAPGTQPLTPGQRAEIERHLDGLLSQGLVLNLDADPDAGTLSPDHQAAYADKVGELRRLVQAAGESSEAGLGRFRSTRIEARPR